MSLITKESIYILIKVKMMTLRTMQQRAPHLFAPQFSVDAENILKKVVKKFVKKFAGNKKVRIFAAHFRNDPPK